MNTMMNKQIDVILSSHEVQDEMMVDATIDWSESDETLEERLNLESGGNSGSSPQC